MHGDEQPSAQSSERCWRCPPSVTSRVHVLPRLPRAGLGCFASSYDEGDVCTASSYPITSRDVLLYCPVHHDQDVCIAPRPKNSYLIHIYSMCKNKPPQRACNPLLTPRTNTPFPLAEQLREGGVQHGPEAYRHHLRRGLGGSLSPRQQDLPRKRAAKVRHAHVLQYHLLIG